MNHLHYKKEDYMRNFIAPSHICRRIVTAYCISESRVHAAHTIVKRISDRQSSDTESLGPIAHLMIQVDPGFPIFDDPSLNKGYPSQNEQITYYLSGNPHQIIKRICLVLLLWTGGVLNETVLQEAIR